MSVKKNIIANYLGKVLLTLLSIVFIPIYLTYLGIESYALVGIYAMLLSMMMLVDIGMGHTIVREVARYTSGKLSLIEIHDILKTFKYLYFTIGILLFVGIYTLSDFIALNWLSIENLLREDVILSLETISAMIFINWLSILYRNSIVGLQFQVWLNIVDVAFAIVSKVGVIFVLAFISPTIISFLFFQLIIMLIHFFVMVYKLNKLLPKENYKPKFSFNVIKKLWRFASGVALTTMFGTLLSQADKFILSALLSLKTFGLYTIASIVGRALGLIISPITLAIRPKMTTLYEQNNEVKLIEFYHKSAQLMSVLSIPIGIALILFSKDILWIWTNDIHLVEQIYIIVSLLVMGTLLNGMMHVPYSLQLSAGWSSLTAKSNIVLFFIMVPILIIFIDLYGMIAAPIVWIVINIVYVFVIIGLMHKRLLRTEKWNWYIDDVFKILLSSLLVGLVCRYFIEFDQNINKFIYLVELFLSYIFILISGLLSSNIYKTKILNKIREMNYV